MRGGHYARELQTCIDAREQHGYQVGLCITGIFSRLLFPEHLDPIELGDRVAGALYDENGRRQEDDKLCRMW